MQEKRTKITSPRIMYLKVSEFLNFMGLPPMFFPAKNFFHSTGGKARSGVLFFMQSLLILFVFLISVISIKIQTKNATMWYLVRTATKLATQLATFNPSLSLFPARCMMSRVI